MRRKRIFGTALAALVLAGAAGVAGWQGLQTCGWIDRALGPSGCLGTVSFDGVGLSRTSVAQPMGDGRVVMAVDMRTAAGWRLGLIVLDPVTGAEDGRYPLPMREPAAVPVARRKPAADRLRCHRAVFHGMGR